MDPEFSAEAISRSGTGFAGSISPDTLPSAALTGFRELVSDLGTDPAPLLCDADIPLAALDLPHTQIPWIGIATLLERTARQLGCPDFGMRLAERQDALRLSRPLERLFTNAPSYYEALKWTAAHGRAYTSAVRNTISHDPERRIYVDRFHLPYEGAPLFPQFVELLVLLGQKAVVEITGGLVRAHEVWFAHSRLSSQAHYRAKFGSTVRFDREYDAMFFTEQAIHAPAIAADARVFAAEREALASRFPRQQESFEQRVRDEIKLMLSEGGCERADLVRRLNTSSSALHRRLQGNGQSFEKLRDEVRRNIALRYLSSEVSLTELSARLGYAEATVFSRSCRRWFGCSPSALRRELTRGKTLGGRR